MEENIYIQCRKKAAKYDDRLNSRDRAAELLGISESSLTHYELGITKNIPVDIIVMMAERYHAPELKYHYCKNECPIGKNLPISPEEKTIEQATVHLLDSLNNERISRITSKLLHIARDGNVSEQESDELASIVDELHYVTQAIHELQLIVEKNTKTGRK